jgi:hypothetical protein
MSRTHDVTISAFDLDRIESELASVTEQRDRLAEALRKLVLWADCASRYMGNSHDICWEAKEALAVVKGGSDE